MTAAFTERVWADAASVRAAVDAHPFVRELGAGTLDPARFTYYLAQDAHYLQSYARALAAAAVKADTTADLAFFAKAAHDAVVVEQELHRAHVGDIERHPRSPTCVGYTSYLLGVAQTHGYPELVAALLPCYSIYQDLGARMLARAGDLAGHPYADWIAMYADPSFEIATSAARAIADRLALTADGATLTRMAEAFAMGVRWEWAFWDAAWRQESWPV